MITDDKDGELEPYRDSDCLWIEDKPKNFELGEKMGLRSRLVRHSYNAQLWNELDEAGQRYKSFNYWEELYKSLKSNKSYY